jgi:hypothetical protein
MLLVGFTALASENSETSGDMSIKLVTQIGLA